jgi:hypothetical protein
MSILVGTPSDDTPAILAAGKAGVSALFVSMSGAHPEGRDGDYLAWHALDHRPEQHRLARLRASLRLVSTAACRAARAASSDRYDRVDHVMTYCFSDVAGLRDFAELNHAMTKAGRTPYLLPTVERSVYNLEGMAATPRIRIGADVLPWYPAKGIYLLIERGLWSPAGLLEVPGVAGAWWGGSLPVDPAYVTTSNDGLHITYLFLDADPAEAGERLRSSLGERWQRTGIEPLLAAPFHVCDPHEPTRFLP